MPEAAAACLLSVIDTCIPPLLLPNEICLKVFYKLTPQNKHTHTHTEILFAYRKIGQVFAFVGLERVRLFSRLSL